MYRIRLIDIDNDEKIRRGKAVFPNLALMKLSSWHKRQGDEVAFYDPMFDQNIDTVYMSKIFNFTPDYPWPVNAKRILRGGSGYCIEVGKDGKEHFQYDKDICLPNEIEHSFPDYELYGISDTAYGFMSRGCPRGCGFCIVGNKEGRRSRKVADLSEFWNGQKKIELMDPNTLACGEWKDILGQLSESQALVDINQGCDIRLMTDEKAEMIRKIRMRSIHFAFDNPEDAPIIKPKLKAFKDITRWERKKVMVYCLVNFQSNLEEDLDRIYYIRSLNFQPYVMIYEKYKLPQKHILRRLQRWVNNPIIFWSTNSFKDYLDRIGQ